MSDRIAVFNDGRIEQIGTPAEVYEQPATAFVAGFVGTSNLLRGEAALKVLGLGGDLQRPPREDPRRRDRRPRRRGRALGERHGGARSSTSATPRASSSSSTPAASSSRCSRTPTRRRPTCAELRGSRVRLVWRREHDVPRRGLTSPPGPTGPHPAPGQLVRGDHEQEVAGAHHALARWRPPAPPSSCWRLPAAAPAPRTIVDGGTTGAAVAAAPPAGTAASAVGAGEGELNIVAWAGYAEDGSTDPKVDWVTPFEKATGCKVNVKIGNTSDEMVTLMKTGQYDGVSASGDATLRLIYGGDVAPVNTALVPNYATISQFLKNKPWNSVNGVSVRHPARLGRQPADVQHRRRHRRRRRRGAPCSTRARRTRARSRPTTRRSTSPTPRCT